MLDILAGIEASSNVKAFLSLPLKFRIYPKIIRDIHNVQVEGRLARQRWNIREQKSHPGEDLESHRRRKKQECEKREPLQGECVDFSKMRVTSFLCNKYIHMPQAAPDREEVEIGAERIHLLDTWDLYVGQNVNDKGTHVSSCNLTAEQELGRK